jgi:hypothetical protein
MPILTTTIEGTHTNQIQTAAIFKTRAINSTSNAIIVEIEVQRDGHRVDHNDFALDSQERTHVVDMGAESITLSGELKFDLSANAVIFTGGLVFPGQVNVQMRPVIVATL